jgi:hypothetical protein
VGPRTAVTGSIRGGRRAGGISTSLGDQLRPGNSLALN